MTILADYNPVQRFRIILGGILLLGFAAYFLSIRNTIQLHGDLNEKMEQLEDLANAPQSIATLRQQLQQLDGQLLGGQYDRNLLFDKLSSFCASNQLQLLEFGEEQRWQEGEITYINNPVLVAGSYQEILRLMYMLEQEQRLGYLSHCEMVLQRKDRRRRTEELQANIHIQYLEIDQ